jgi:hypothetical protein
MLLVPTKIFRIKAAALLAALYLVCALAPAAAFALAGTGQDTASAELLLERAMIEHCLGEGHLVAQPQLDDGASVGAAPPPFPPPQAGEGRVGAGSARHGNSGDDTDGKSANCCILFSVAGFSGESRMTFAASSLASMGLPMRADVLHGRTPERIDRPPIA